MRKRQGVDFATIPLLFSHPFVSGKGPWSSRHPPPPPSPPRAPRQRPAPASCVPRPPPQRLRAAAATALRSATATPSLPGGRVRLHLAIRDVGVGATVEQHGGQAGSGVVPHGQEEGAPLRSGRSRLHVRAANSSWTVPRRVSTSAASSRRWPPARVQGRAGFSSIHLVVEWIGAEGQQQTQNSAVREPAGFAQRRLRIEAVRARAARLRCPDEPAVRVGVGSSLEQAQDDAVGRGLGLDLALHAPSTRHGLDEGRLPARVALVQASPGTRRRRPPRLRRCRSARRNARAYLYSRRPSLQSDRRARRRRRASAAPRRGKSLAEPLGKRMHLHLIDNAWTSFMRCAARNLQRVFQRQRLLRAAGQTEARMDIVKARQKGTDRSQRLRR